MPSDEAVMTDDFLAGGGESGALMRALDWSQNPLGPPSGWPRSLKMMVRVILASRFAMRVLWGPEFIFLYNDGYRPVLGASKHPSAMGSRTSESFREVWPIVGPLFEKVLRGESSALEDGLLPLDRNGYLEECYFTLSYSPIPDDDGRIGGVLGVVHETTERVLAQRRLATLRDLAAVAALAMSPESACRRYAETLAESGPDVPFSLLYLVGERGDVATLAAVGGLDAGHPAIPETIELGAGASSTGWPLGLALASRAAVEIDDVEARFGALNAGPYPEPVRSALVLPIGPPGLELPYAFVVFGVNPRRALDPSYRSFFSLVSDHVATGISNAFAFQAERHRAEQLAALDRQKTAFFGNVSHEFRTPLTLMIGPLAEALAAPEPALKGRALGAAHRNAVRLLKLVNTLLDFSRMEAERHQGRYEPTDLAATTRELGGAFEALAEKAHLGLVIDCPPLREPVYVDREMWEKIVLNLVSNAFKFTFEGSIRISLRAVPALRLVELLVSDTGVGVPAAEIPHLFERFHRVEATRARTHEGSGIGLALVQELTRLHHGTVEITSELGRGTTVAVRLPLGAAHLPADAIGVGDARSAPLGVAPFVDEAAGWIDAPDEAVDSVLDLSEPARTRGARVLLVDDNADMRVYVARVLGREFAVEAVGDGATALARMRAEPPELVLTDLMMPELDGFGLVVAVRADPDLRHVPVIVLSARAGEESRVAGLEAGADDYLTKPFSPRELTARVRGHIELGRLRARIGNERRALVEAERARMTSLFAQAPVGICLLRGPEHVYDLANPVYLELIGGRDVLGKPLREALPELAHVVIPMLDGVYRTGVALFGSEVELPLLRDGVLGITYFNFVYSAVRDERGQVEGVAVVASEVTEQVRSRKVAERLSLELAASNRELDQFAYVASHDLKAPLRGISNLATWIEEGLVGKLEPETKEQLELLRGRVHRLELLVDGVLAYSRAGRTRGQVERVDLAALLAETRELLAPPESASVVIEAPMPVLEAERVLLQQVFLNLIGNALKHARRDDPRVVVSSEEEGAFFHFKVSDNGPGIEPRYHERIWTIFTTLEARDKVEGAGIGLSVVKKIVEGRGGRVGVESEAGRGAIFHVHWPRRS